MPRLIDRLLGRGGADEEPKSLIVAPEYSPKRLLLPDVKDGPVPERKSSFGLLPKGAYGANYAFFSPDGGRTMFELADPASIAFVAYWYVATRWRAQKIAEAPLMVVAEDQDSGDEEWIADHDLAPLLEDPSPDYDMGELLETISHFLDNDGCALLVKSRMNNGTPARLTPFCKRDFEIHSDATRIFASFTVRTADGSEEFDAEEVIFFRDFHGSRGLKHGRSRLDVAMSWLKLGARAQQTIYDLLANSVWPSLVVIPDKDWDPDEGVYKEYKQDVQQYAKAGNKGKPFIALGGGAVESLQASIKDLVPDEVLGRVESVVAAVSGVPAIVLQFQIGMENSPWSQMAQARRMAYDDVIQPTWRKWERTFTKQLLRGEDDDPTHFVKFDASNVVALQTDQLIQAQIAQTIGKQASLNERRAIIGLEPVPDDQDTDGRADEIPELTQPDLATLLAGVGATPPGGGADGPEEDATAEADGVAKKATTIETERKLWLERKLKTAALQDALREEAVPLYVVVAQRQLKNDARKISQIVLHSLLDENDGKAMTTKARGKDTVMSSISRYLAEDGRKTWTAAMQPLNQKAAQQSGALMASDMNINFSLLNGNLLTFARKQTGKMITDVNKTTQSLVSDIIQGGIDAKQSTRAIAKTIEEATGFDRSRAELIARTESTKAFNGAPTESLSVLGQHTGRAFTKEWSGLLDDKERQEHLDMEGEVVGISETFSNDLQYPSEPNCRCSLLYDEVDT